jgi:hypothetical protein
MPIKLIAFHQCFAVLRSNSIESLETLPLQVLAGSRATVEQRRLRRLDEKLLDLRVKLQ